MSGKVHPDSTLSMPDANDTMPPAVEKPPAKPSAWSDRKEQFYEFCDETTMHGWADYKRTYKMRPFWALIVLGFLTIAFVQIYLMIKNVHDNPYYTEFDERLYNEMALPTIQICPSNDVSAERAHAIPPSALEQALVYRSSLGTSIVYETDEVKWVHMIPSIPRQDEQHEIFVEYVESPTLRGIMADVVLRMLLCGEDLDCVYNELKSDVSHLMDTAFNSTDAEHRQDMLGELILQLYTAEIGAVLNCTVADFQCNKICIHGIYVCNNEFDCADRSDEAQCQRACDEYKEFKCTNERCISIDQRCDGNDDCYDGSDEAQCIRYNCPETKFACGDNKQCIDAHKYCDGVYDCNDATDEQSCFYGVGALEKNIRSMPSTIRCDGKYVPPWQQCDGNIDCYNGEDEHRHSCDRMDCFKNQTRIWKIYHDELLHLCTLTELLCKDAILGDMTHTECGGSSAVSLTEISSGRLLAKLPEDTYPVCRHGLTESVIIVVKHSLGYDRCDETHMESHMSSKALANIRCTGSETNIAQCAYDIVPNCDSYDGQATLRCHAEPIARLTNLNQTLEVNDGGTWKQVCMDNFDLEYAIAVCRDMSYARGYMYGTSLTGNVTSTVNRLMCKDRHLDHCTVTSSTSVCASGLTLTCVPYMENMRLSEGYDGYIQLMYHHEWATVVQDIEYFKEGYFDTVCTELGYDGKFHHVWHTEHVGLNTDVELFCKEAPSVQKGILVACELWGDHLNNDHQFKPPMFECSTPFKLPKCSANEYQCRSGLCIDEHKLCDGTVDCPSLEDEVQSECQEYYEHFDWHRCNEHTTAHYPPRTRCSGHWWCAGGHEDHHCENCTDGSLLCSDGSTCVPSEYWCDGKEHCPDGSDEPDTCSTCHHHHSTLHQCAGGPPVKCLDDQYICDGIFQCNQTRKDMTDFSDEVNCEEAKLCDKQPYKYRCPGLNLCFNWEDICDGIKHCPDGYDEDAMCEQVCDSHPHLFRCSNGTCMSTDIRCNYMNDCGDWSDERDCGRMNVHPPKFNTVPTRYIPKEDTLLRQYLSDLMRNAPRILHKNYLPRPGHLDVVKLNNDISFGFDEIIQLCQFMNAPLSNCSAIGSTVYNPKYGTCFNIRPTENQTTAGLGMSVLLDVNFDNQLNIIGGDMFLPSPTDGVTITFLDENGLKSSREYHVPISQAAFFSMKRTDYNRLVTKDRQQCMDEMDAKFLSAPTYTTQSCQTECLLSYLWQQCTCLQPLSPAALKSDANMTVCLTRLERICYLKAMKSRKANADHTKCLMNCLPACLETAYDADISFEAYPSAEMFNIVYNIPLLRFFIEDHNKKYLSESEVGDWGDFLHELHTDTWHQMMGAYYFHVFEKTQEEIKLMHEGAEAKITGHCSYEDPKHQDLSACEVTAKRLTDHYKAGQILILYAYDSFQIMTIEKHLRMEFVDYFAGIGGFLGLWSGASTISFIQLFVFLAQFLCPWLDKKKKKDQEEEDEEVIYRPLSEIDRARIVDELEARLKNNSKMQVSPEMLAGSMWLAHETTIINQLIQKTNQQNAKNEERPSSAPSPPVPFPNTQNVESEPPKPAAEPSQPHPDPQPDKGVNVTDRAAPVPEVTTRQQSPDPATAPSSKPSPPSTPVANDESDDDECTFEKMIYESEGLAEMPPLPVD